MVLATITNGILSAEHSHFTRNDEGVQACPFAICTKNGSNKTENKSDFWRTLFIVLVNLILSYSSLNLAALQATIEKLNRGQIRSEVENLSGCGTA